MHLDTTMLKRAEELEVEKPDKTKINKKLIKNWDITILALEDTIALKNRIPRDKFKNPVLRSVWKVFRVKR